jgi:hypothetical protein
MKHFTYEIDEKTLREQLKNIAIPLKDENWHRFEQYSDAQTPVQVPRNRLASLQVSINRNVVLPVVFGAVIIMFSLLLFNFISIKNPAETIKASSTSNAQVMLPQIRPDLSPILPAKNPEAQPVKKVDEIKVTAKEIKKEVRSAGNGSSTEQLTLEVADNTKIEKPQRLARKLETEPAVNEALLSNIRPDIITEDTDPEIRPK